MRLHQELITEYLEYCQYRKRLDFKTIKAYRIDLEQFLIYVENEVIEKKR